MKLLITPTSPYARKAHIVVLEKQLACEVVPAVPWDNEAIVTDNNPLRKIPILLTDAGDSIIDSRTICEYLDAQNDHHRVLPSDFAACIETKTREALADGALDACLAVIMAGRVAPSMQNDDWKDWLMQKTKNTVAHFDRIIADRPADAFDLGDIALACLLGTLDFRFTEYDWKSAHPALARRAKAFNERPAVVATIPKI